eukprot:2156345-Rhodomonas_salina.1
MPAVKSWNLYRKVEETGSKSPAKTVGRTRRAQVLDTIIHDKTGKTRKIAHQLPRQRALAMQFVCGPEKTPVIEMESLLVDTRVLGIEKRGTSSWSAVISLNLLSKNATCLVRRPSN